MLAVQDLVIRQFLLLFEPFAPFITEELWTLLGYNASGAKFLQDARIGTAESIVGKLEVVRDISFTAVEAYATVRIMATGKSPAVAHAAAAAGVESMKATANEVGEYLAGKKVSFGFLAQDLDTVLRWQSGVEERVPLLVKAGAAYFPEENLAFAVDYSFFNDTKMYFTPAFELSASVCTLQLLSKE